MPKTAVVSDAVKNLEVDKGEFDRVLKKLIATRPIRAGDLKGKGKPWSLRPPLRAK